MDFTNIIVTKEDGIATITFNRPQALNALNGALIDELSQTIDDIANDDSVRVLILTGAGDKAFVAGADINELSKLSPLEAKWFSKKGHNAFNKLEALSIPVIAAVNGYALGGGTEVALACDFIYASEKAVFGQPEINLGIIPGFGGTQRLARLIGKNLAKEYILTGKMIPAEEAKAIGLVNKVCKPEELLPETVKCAQLMRSKGRFSLFAAKQTINGGLNLDLASGLNIEVDAFALCMASEDAKEGTTAFLEKRKPEFKGKIK